LSEVITINASDRRKALAEIGAATNYEELLDHLKHEQEHHQPYQVDPFMSVEMHTDIRVLEARFENLDKSVGVVSAKIDQLMSTQEHFIRLQEQHEQTRESLDRAMLIINTMTNLASETDARLNKALYFIRGGAAVGTFLFVFAQWYVLEQLEGIRQIESAVDLAEHRLTVIEEAHKPKPIENHLTWPQVGEPRQ